MRVNTAPDDDALTWGGDDDPTLLQGSPDQAADSSSAPALPDGYTAVGRGSERVGRITADGTVVAASEAPPMGNAMLIGLGIVGGVYALFTIGWIIGGLRLQGVAVFLISPVAYLPAFWLAVAAPAIWFATALALTRRSASWVRLVWLIAGAILLVPWPFVMTGSVGQ